MLRRAGGRDGLRRPRAQARRRTTSPTGARSGRKRIIAPDPHDFIAFTEDYPSYFGDDYEFEIVLGVELVNDLVKEGRIELTRPVERTVTYHDPCRLNKRKGVHKAPRELLRAVPGITFNGRRPRHAVVLLLRRRRRAADREARDHGRDRRRRVAKAAELEVDTLISACPWSERPLAAAGQEARTSR